MARNISDEERLRRSKNMTEVNKLKRKDFTKEELIDLYVNKKMYIGDVAEALSSSVQTVKRRLQEYGIPKNGVRKPHKEIFTKEELIDLYINKNMQRQEIVDKYNISLKQLIRLFNIYEIKKPKELEIANRVENTQEKYGVNSTLQLESVRNKIKKTNLEKYGSENPYGSKQIREKIKQTNLERYGVENVWSKGSPFLEKVKQTNLERYGAKNPYSSDIIKERIVKTNLEKYGVEWYCTAEHAINANKPYKISKVNQEFSKVLNKNSIQNTLEYNNYDIKLNDTNIVIEINPTYTHNSTLPSVFKHGVHNEVKDSLYHQLKSKKAKELGLRCIHIFDWDSWTKIVSMLQPKETLYARKCELKEVSTNECNEFLNMYHLQGTCQKQDIRLGLYYNNELVELMTFGKPRYNKKYEYELLRLCSHKDYSVTGGTQKLFKYFIDTYKPQSIISYCDMSKFDGNVYERLGFELKSESKPSKHWYNEKTSKHITDNLLRQRGFDQLFGTSYGKGTSNEELMIEHGFVEIFDCGQNTYVYERKDDN